MRRTFEDEALPAGRTAHEKRKLCPTIGWASTCRLPGEIRTGPLPADLVGAGWRHGAWALTLGIFWQRSREEKNLLPI